MKRVSISLLLFLLGTVIEPLFPSQSATNELNRQDLELLDVESNDDNDAESVQFNCLPQGYKLTDIVSYTPKQKGSDEYITIKDKLIELKARCKDGTLVDNKGREIRFFKFSCFGNPPIDFDEIRQREHSELERLQKDYTVIVLACDPKTS